MILPLPKPVIYCGPGSSKQLCCSVAQLGYCRILIVTDAALNQMGLLDDIKSLLLKAGVKYSIYDQVEPNPTFSQVEEGLNVALDNSCDAVLAFGGGSPIDAAKLISIAATNVKSPRQLVGYFKAKNKGLPIFAVPTTAGTGSEISIASVISDPVNHKKGIIVDTKIIPVAAALDPSLMLGLPPAITAATGIDVLTHAVEAFLSKIATKESDDYARASVRLVFQNLRRAYEQGQDVEAREAMAIASYYAAMAFNKAALGYAHGISHQFTSYYSTPHGLANAITLPYVLDFYKKSCTSKLAELAIIASIGDTTDSHESLALKFIAAVRDLNASLGIPQKLNSVRVGDIAGIAKDALRESHYNYAVPTYMSEGQCIDLIKNIAA